MKNICIESHVLNHPHRSGLMTYTEGLINGLAAKDSINRYALAYYSLKRRPQEMPGPENSNFRKFVLKAPDREFYGRQAFIDQLVLPTFFKANNIHIFHRPAGYTMPRVKNIFSILTIHDLRTLTIDDQFWAQNIENYRRTLHAIDICVVVSECTKKDLLRHFNMDEHKVRVIYLGADASFKPVDKQAVDAVCSKFDIRQPFLLSMGSLPRKNIQGVVEGFGGAKCKNNFTLVLRCNHDVEKYRALAHDLGIPKLVFIQNELTNEDVVALYGACHCFIFPSFYEGFGLPILEAMQCGAPVITSNVSSCPEVAGSAAILVDPGNIREISDAIDQVLTNERLRRELIAKGLQQAKFFSWNKYAEELHNIYSMA